MVDFVSYDGRYPCLCSGTLILRIDGMEVSLEGYLVSGGHCYWNSENVGLGKVTRGKWRLHNLPEEYEHCRDEILKVVNDNVPYGCCGGCL